VRRAVGELEFIGAQVRHDDAVEAVPEIFELTGQVRGRLAQQRKLRAVIDVAVQQNSAPPLKELHGCFRLPGGDRHGCGVGRDTCVLGEHALLVPPFHAPPCCRVQQFDRERVQAQAHGGLAAAGGKDRAGLRDVEAPQDRQPGIASGQLVRLDGSSRRLRIPGEVVPDGQGVSQARGEQRR
jgi:hypothetical protein